MMCALLLQSIVCLQVAGTPTVDFVRDVRPILNTHCIDCHGADVQEAGLRVDVGIGVLQGGDSGPTVVANQSSESLLVQVVLGTHADISQMPLDSDPLSAEQIKTLRDWIDEGAKLPDREKHLIVKSDHWSFQSVVRPKLPAVSAKDWPRNEIDRFILAKLEKEGIAPSPPADKATLLRRLYLDLIGLPPTPEQVQQFLADDAEKAYEQQVKQLLASPHFGERWGRHWLDVARYADSNGYTIDGPRDIWKYRDWVIDALNQDMPFDQFVIEQLAGDLLPNPSLQQQIATGFHRNTMFNQEGGTDPEQFRVERVIDRVNTTGEAFLALTLGCAQCHSHKYDPISQRDYYQVYAFFNNSDEPVLRVPTEAEEHEQQQLRNAMAARDRELAKARPQWLKQFTDVTTAWNIMPPAEFVSEGGASHSVLDDGSVLLSGANPDVDVYTFTTEAFSEPVAGFRLEVLPDESLPSKGPGRPANGNFVLSEISISVTPNGSDKPQPLAIAHTAADFEQTGYPVAYTIDGNAETGWAINTSGNGPMNVARTAMFTLKEPCATAGRYTVTIRHCPRNPGYNVGRFRLSFTSQPGPFQIIPEDVRAILAVAEELRTKEQTKRLVQYHRDSDPEYTRLANELKAAQQRVPTTMVIRERPEPRTTFVHLRGDFLNKGPEVEPNVPAVLGGMPEAEFSNRLDFARWLVSGENPLTARVTVNRIWQCLFGVGIVETENDFGTQGSPPTHPDLLDWLASEFVSQGWSMKKMIREIVTSATYRQSSHDRPDLESIDPTNRLLARQRRIRVEAEIVRDITLSVSGLLCDSIGGPSVFPYQPDGVMDLPQVKREWKVSPGGDQYRRGMYTFFWRTSPHPFLKLLDAPEALTTCTRRDRSNTPLQALLLLNDEAFVECARNLASRLVAQTGMSDAERVDWAFQLCVARKPSSSEQEVLLKLLTDQRRILTADRMKAVAQPPLSSQELEHETWTAVARALLNLDELITRE